MGTSNSCKGWLQSLVTPVLNTITQGYSLGDISMDTDNDFVERRQHERFKMKENVFAVLLSDSPIIAQVKEISKGGLTVRYFGSERSGKMSEFDIFVSDNDIHLRKVPFETTSNFDVTIQFSESSLKIRQRGGKFGELTQDQKSQLDYLIQNYAMDK